MLIQKNLKSFMEAVGMSIFTHKAINVKFLCEFFLPESAESLLHNEAF